MLTEDDIIFDNSFQQHNRLLTVISYLQYLNVGIHPAVDLKSKETGSFCAILVGCIKSSAHPVDKNQSADSWSSEESVAAALWE